MNQRGAKRISSAWRSEFHAKESLECAIQCHGICSLSLTCIARGAQQVSKDSCKEPDRTAPCVPGRNATLGARKSGANAFLGDRHGELASPTPKLAQTDIAAFPPKSKSGLIDGVNIILI